MDKQNKIAVRTFASAFASALSESLEQAIGSPWLLGYDDQGPYYYSDGYPGALPDANAPAAPDTGPAPTQPIVAYRPGCRTTTQTVPAERGGTSKVSITRCY